MLGMKLVHTKFKENTLNGNGRQTLKFIIVTGSLFRKNSSSYNRMSPLQAWWAEQSGHF